MAVQILDYETAKQTLADKWQKKGAHELLTSPLFSTAYVAFEIHSPVPAANPTIAFAVAKPQQLEWFGYKDGEEIADGFGGTRASTKDETNLTKGREVPGGRDMAVEALSLTVLPAQARWSEADLRDEDLSPEVSRALVGGNGAPPLFFDPGSVTTPPQLHSPFNLEDVFGGIVRHCLELTVEWDSGKTRRRLGLAEGVGEGKGRSYLRTHGEPNNRGSRWVVGEGLIWESAGESDKELIIEGRLYRPLVIPITLPTALLGLTFDDARPVPTGISVGLRAYLHGVQFGKPSKA